MMVGPSHKHCRMLCKPPAGAVVKSYGAERAGKDVVQTASGRYKEAERK